ncbi:MAG TPA: NAD(P)-dependent oxidoreductase, partial [Ilumatobacteraceae bacterium]|nr:NAD(P)-dependent oxidoreductase [Ilumatobacteraceae bacterium]
AYGSEISQWTVGLVGLGNINAAVASRLAAFGVTVLGARRNVDADAVAGVDQVYPISRLNDMLARCDAVVAAVPETADSIGLFGAKQFAVMKRDALFVNIGRGSAVDEMALIGALESGHLGGAALDVASEEPLPAGHPLWSAPNVAISGHCAASPAAMFPNLYRLFADNLARLLRGDSLRNEVDLNRGY